MIENLSRAKKLSVLAWSIEIVLVSVGLSVAFAQAASMPSGTSPIQAVPVFGVFVALAAVELAKIPAATVAFHAKRWTRVFALCGLLVTSIISFETIFNGFERFVHATTAPVVSARIELAEINDEIKGAESVALESETNGTSVDQADAKQRQLLTDSLKSYNQVLAEAVSNLESTETRELRVQLAGVLKQQQAAGDAAAESWQNEQKSIMDRLASDDITERLRSQLNGRMYSMPAQQVAVAAARAVKDAEVQSLNEKIKASISEPSAESKMAAKRAQADRDLAAKALQDFEVESNSRAANRIQGLVDAETVSRARSVQIEALERDAVAAQKKVAEMADNAQMYRWASFIFGMNASEVPDDKAKQVGAAFGFMLALVGALTGSSVAMYSEWFRVRGVAPRIEVRNVRVEVIVEKEIEKRVEVEVPTIKYTYVPIPIGEDVDDAVASILNALPEEAASQLRGQLSHLSKNRGPVGGITNARAA